MKKELFLGLIFILGIGVISAYGGSFNNLSLTGLFSELNVSMYLNALLFLTLFAALYWLVGKSPLGENRAVNWIVSLCLASFSLWGILRSGFSLQNLLYSLGISEDLLPTLLWIIGIAICVFLIIKFSFRKFLGILSMLAGATLIILSLLDMVYAKGAGIMIGAGLLLLGLILSKSGSGRKVLGYGISAGKGIGKFGGWMYNKRPTGFFLNKEKRIAKKIEYLEKEYQRATNKGDHKGAKDFRDQIEYLVKRMEELKQKERKTYQQYAKRVEYAQKNQGSSALVPTDKNQIKRSISILKDEYNKIQRQNPRDPRLYQMAKDIKELRRRL